MDAHHDRHLVNNEMYDHLHDRWYTAKDDPVALLRAETRAKIKWAEPLLTNHYSKKILDVGCGAGFATHLLAQKNFKMTGLDFSENSLAVAKKMDSTQSINYIQGDAYHLPFADQSFDAVLAFDFLEHVSNPQAVVDEISRVLKPQGQFLFHTFNRNLMAWFIVIKGVEWFVKNTPKNLHTLPLFIKPKELEIFCQKNQMKVDQWIGLRPKINSAFFEMLKTGCVPDQFEFLHTKSKMISYCGRAIKG